MPLAERPSVVVAAAAYLALVFLIGLYALRIILINNAALFY